MFSDTKYIISNQEKKCRKLLSDGAILPLTFGFYSSPIFIQNTAGARKAFTSPLNNGYCAIIWFVFDIEQSVIKEQLTEDTD